MAIDFNTDPYGAWGTLLGTVLGQSYNKNAQNRERAKADKIIDSIRNQQEIERIAALRQPPTNEDAVDLATKRAVQQDAPPIGGVTKGIDYLGMGDKYGENPYQFGTAESYLDKMFKPAGGKQYAIEQANKASVDAIHANQKQQAQLSPYERILSNWNPDYTEDNVRAKLKAADVRDSIIDEKLGEVRKDVEKRAKEVFLPSIQKKMFYGYDTVEKGEDGNLYSVHHDPDAVSFMQAMAELETLKQYSPDTYKTYARQIVGPLALYNEKVADKRYDKQVKVARENAIQNRVWNLEDKEQNFKERVYFAGLKSKNGKYSISTADYKEAQKRAGEIEAYYQEHKAVNPNFKLPPSMQEEWEESRAMIKQYRRERIGKTGNGQYTNNHSDVSDSDKQGIDWNDWNSINAGINQVLKDGYTAKDVLETAAEHLGTDHPWYKIIASSFDHEGAKRRKEEEAAARQKRLNETLYPGTNDVNTVDQTIAKIAEIGSDIANGRPLWNLAHGK